MGGRISFGPRIGGSPGPIETPPPPVTTGAPTEVPLADRAKAKSLIDPRDRKGDPPNGPKIAKGSLMLQHATESAKTKKKDQTGKGDETKERKAALDDYRKGKIDAEALKARLDRIGVVKEPEDAIRGRLSARVGEIRRDYLGGKPVGKGNAAALEAHVEGGHVLRSGATSRASSPAPLPEPKSRGGQFEPTVDSVSGRVMDTDAEYKALSELASKLEKDGLQDAKGKVFLHTELYPCESCLDVIKQFREKFPRMEVEVTWDHPYPFGGGAS
jgi:hypothetical protein